MLLGKPSPAFHEAQNFAIRPGPVEAHHLPRRLYRSTELASCRRVLDSRCAAVPNSVRCEAATMADRRDSSANALSSETPRRRLIIMRHADSQDSSHVRDHDRSITEAGRNSAAEVAKKLKQMGWLPDLIVCSNAMRTKQTLQSMTEAVATFGAAVTEFRGSLYTVAALDGQTRRHLQELISEAAESVKAKCVLCLGHNKGWEEAASDFAAQQVRLETANAALLEGSGASWDDAFSEQWSLVHTVMPEA
ncbi:hypothetical protein WJX74_008747 [Apatococcus lobatus]|uniref:Phosphohistidine phosphatase n=1 Tax=Apatococcus lobatus TaxID=904363 RepID=A0AAW1RLW1_9CHLO